MPKQRLVVGMSGATGTLYAVRLLQLLREHLPQVETHLVVSPSALVTSQHEMQLGRAQLHALADVSYHIKDVGATLASGAFDTVGMVIVPCSMRTLAACAQGLSDNLITRAADVHLKERRRLVLAVRETPLNLAHLRNMTAVTEMGGIIFPPVPAFYQHPQTLQDMVDHSVHRMLALCGLPLPQAPSWSGLS